MTLRYNREGFTNDIDSIVRNVIVPFHDRYVTYHVAR